MYNDDDDEIESDKSDKEEIEYDEEENEIEEYNDEEDDLEENKKEKEKFEEDDEEESEGEKERKGGVGSSGGNAYSNALGGGEGSSQGALPLRGSSHYMFFDADGKGGAKKKRAAKVAGTEAEGSKAPAKKKGKKGKKEEEEKEEKDGSESE